MITKLDFVGVETELMYPRALGDLFKNSQLVIVGRDKNNMGPATIRLTGKVGKEPRDYSFETAFPDKTPADRGFVEHLWARRKVGFLLDQIRANGEKKVSSAELSPATTVLSTEIGSATAPSRGNAKSRLSPASSPNRITRSRAFWLAGGSC